MNARDLLRKRIRSDQTLQKSITNQISSEDHAGEGDLKTLKIDKISLNPNNPRRLGISVEYIHQFVNDAQKELVNKEIKADFYNSEYIETLLNNIKKISDKSKAQNIEKILYLAKSIHDQTLIQPISVISDSEGNFIIQAGERRYLAYVLLERETIRAMVRQKSNDSLKEHSIALIENIIRDDLNTSEKLDYIEELVQIYEFQENRKITSQKLSELIHESERTCRRYVRFMNSSDQIRNDIRAGELKTVREIESAIIKNEETTRVSKKIIKNDRVGRKKTNVSLGKTNDTKVIKTIADALIKSQYLDMEEKVDWERMDDVQKYWDKLLKQISNLK